MTKDNPYVFYELFNEPYLSNKGDENFTTYYAGNSVYAGMRQIYDEIRKNDPTGLIIMAGAQAYAYDATTLIAFWLQYKVDTGDYPVGLIFNFHPYQGGGQGNEKAPQVVLRELLAAKTIAPVIVTEVKIILCISYINH